MTRYEHLNVYKETYNLTKILFGIVSKFPRDFRITLGNKIINTNIDILELILFINSVQKNNREEYFSKLLMKLNLLSVYIELSGDFKFFVNENLYLTVLGNIGKITKMTKNWKESI